MSSYESRAAWKACARWEQPRRKYASRRAAHTFFSLSQIIRRAVSGMLPKNKLRERRLERLKIFPDDAHPYASK